MRLQKVYMPLLIAATIAVIIAIIQVENWGIWAVFVLAASLIGTSKDAKAITWVQFMPAGLITLFLFYVIYEYANPMWHRVVAMQTENIRHIFKWNEAFNAIPLNDAWIFRLWQPEWLTKYMQSVYNAGFTLSYWICVIRAFFTKDVKKLGRYALAGYLLQVPLILPFYNTILLQEVWYVQGTPDLLERVLTPSEQYMTVLNCFPSMHTSIAFAALLLAMREKSRWYKWLLGVFCVSIIISTMYLKIHWIIDVFAGMLFAWGCVKLADVIVNAKFFDAFARRFEGFGSKLFTAMEVRRGKKNSNIGSGE
ncbi:phosphatase PAP2 family protein [Paenibacillus sp. MBLB4367]|uniref:phosphatase PAP2 family protein n=1 Tax=Paenibacillus sp. MBLB4367 TaxID=3384767 RepID=UPI00390842E4